MSGQSLRAASYPLKPGLPPLHSLPSGMNPTVRPPASERSTLNQLYSEFAPLSATADEQAGLFGRISPVPVRPSFQHR